MSTLLGSTVEKSELSIEIRAIDGVFVRVRAEEFEREKRNIKEQHKRGQPLSLRSPLSPTSFRAGAERT